MRIGLVSSNTAFSLGGSGIGGKSPWSRDGSGSAVVVSEQPAENASSAVDDEAAPEGTNAGGSKARDVLPTEDERTDCSTYLLARAPAAAGKEYSHCSCLSTHLEQAGRMRSQRALAVVQDWQAFFRDARARLPDRVILGPEGVVGSGERVPLFWLHRIDVKYECSLPGIAEKLPQQPRKEKTALVAEAGKMIETTPMAQSWV